jgi:hypothetical protein
MNTLSLILIIGILTTPVSISTKLIGLPDKTRQNYIRKSKKGIFTIPIMVLELSPQG